MLKSVDSPEPTIDDIVRKWSPLTKDIHGPAVPLTSWCLEKEARHLNDGFNSLPKGLQGDSLKYIFPAIRKVVPRWFGRSPLHKLASVLDRDPDEVCEDYIADLLADELNLIYLAVCEERPEMADRTLAIFGVIEQRALARRLVSYIESFPADQ